MGKPGGTKFWKAFGPGLLWAGAAVGVSHLVQSTRAGAEFGFGLLGLVLITNVFKYPAFSFGPRYAAATGTSLLEGYRRRGRWALVLYAVLTIGTMFTVQAAVTIVTAALAIAFLRLDAPLVPGAPNLVVLVAGLTLFCVALLAIGRYRWLDRIVKVVVLVLTLSTFAATLRVLPLADFSTVGFLPKAAGLGFVVALVGWMPSAFDISIWHSLWTLARRRDSDHAPTVRESLLDFNVGYLGTVILALCFLTLGAGVMHGSGKTFSPKAAVFAGQVIDLYTENLGGWSRPLIGLSAFTVMLSTTLTVIDGFPRAIATLVARFRAPEVPDHPDAIDRRLYWMATGVLGTGVVAIAARMTGSLPALVDVATTLSFLTAPLLAWLNHRAILGEEVPPEARPGPRLVFWSWAGIVFSLTFALVYLATLVVGQP